MKQLSVCFILIIGLLHGYIFAQQPSDIPQPADTLNRTDASGKKVGYWEEKQGEITFRGEYRSDKKHGNWVGYYPNNVISGLAYYNMGVKDGISIDVDRKGKILLVENFKNGLLDGPARAFSQTGDNPVSDISYASGKKNGLCRLYYDNGKVQEESYYRDDKKSGTSKWNNKSGHLIAEYNYKDGNFDGIQKTFYDNDSIQSLNYYLDNQLSGEYKEYFQNGKVKISGKYVTGVKEGEWKEYDESGKVLKVEKYKSGKTK